MNGIATVELSACGHRGCACRREEVQEESDRSDHLLTVPVTEDTKP